MIAILSLYIAYFADRAVGYLAGQPGELDSILNAFEEEQATQPAAGGRLFLVDGDPGRKSWWSGLLAESQGLQEGRWQSRTPSWSKSETLLLELVPRKRSETPSTSMVSVRPGRWRNLVLKLASTGAPAYSTDDW